MTKNIEYRQTLEVHEALEILIKTSPSDNLMNSSRQKFFDWQSKNENVVKFLRPEIFSLFDANEADEKWKKWKKKNLL